MTSIFDRVENIVEKGENTCYHNIFKTSMFQGSESENGSGQGQERFIVGLTLTVSSKELFGCPWMLLAGLYPVAMVTQ